MKSTSLLGLLFCTIAIAGFRPNVRIDHEDRPYYYCRHAAVTVGPVEHSRQPIYVVFQDDSLFPARRSSIMFQKSADCGRTWLDGDVLIRRGARYAEYPDIVTDPDGVIYVFYDEDSTESSHIYCVRSSDGGATWTTPVQVDDHSSGWIGTPRAAVDSAGHLFVAWNLGHIYSSVSTDKGATWSPRVRVDDDTVSSESYHPDVFVQPGTNHYLVAAQCPFHRPPVITRGAFLYRSTDNGLSFQPGVRLDTFDGYTGSPHVVADRYHVICDYTGQTKSDDLNLTEARTLFCQPDTWGSPSLVSKLDTSQFWSYPQGAKLAISANGRVHTALMVCCDTVEARYSTYYTCSSDHGVAWSELELVSGDTTMDCYHPDIGVDSAGNAYVVWQGRGNGIWFSTNSPVAIAEQSMQPNINVQPSATIVRNVLLLNGLGTRSELPERNSVMSRAALLDIGGRKVMELRPGANDVRMLPPGVYVIEPSLGLHAKVVKLK
jgi:hypothetical protein